MRSDARYCSNTCRQRADRQRRRVHRSNSPTPAPTQPPPGSLLATAWLVLERIASADSIELTGVERKDLQRMQQLMRVKGIHAVGDDVDATEFKRWTRATKWAEPHVADLSS